MWFSLFPSVYEPASDRAFSFSSIIESLATPFAHKILLDQFTRRKPNNEQAQSYLHKIDYKVQLPNKKSNRTQILCIELQWYPPPNMWRRGLLLVKKPNQYNSFFPSNFTTHALYPTPTPPKKNKQKPRRTMTNSIRSTLRLKLLLTNFNQLTDVSCSFCSVSCS
jgi:hypothetical protein